MEETKRQTSERKLTATETQKQAGFVAGAITQYLATNYGQSAEEVEALEAYLGGVRERMADLAEDVKQEAEAAAKEAAKAAAEEAKASGENKKTAAPVQPPVQAQPQHHKKP